MILYNIKCYPKDENVTNSAIYDTIPQKVKLLKNIIIILLLLSSCSNKIMEGHIYITKKYYGKVTTCDTLIRQDFFNEGSMLVSTDSCILILRGNHAFRPGTLVYVHQEAQYRRDNAPIATIDGGEYKLKK